MAARVIALPVIALTALVLLAGIVVIVMLLANPKNRAVGIVLLVIGLLVLIPFGVALVVTRTAYRGPRDGVMIMAEGRGHRMTHDTRHGTQRMRHPVGVPGRSYVVAAPETRRVTARLQGVRESIESIEAAVVEVQAVQESIDRIAQTSHEHAAEETSASSAAESETEATAPERSSSVLGAIGRALGTGIAETKKKQTIELAAEQDVAETDLSQPDEHQPAADENPPPTEESPPLANENPPPAEEEPPPPAETDKPAAAERPAWVDAEPGTVDGVYQVVVKVGPYETSLECDANQRYALWTTMRQYVATYLGPRAAQQVRLTPQIGRRIIQDQWQETNEYSVGPMIQRYVLVKFDDVARGMIKAERSRTIVAGRLWYTGGAVAVVLALLSVLFAGLKIDGATEGAYRGRLCLAGVAVMMPVIAVVYLVLASAPAHPVTLDTAAVELTSHAVSNPGAGAPRVLFEETKYYSLGAWGVAVAIFLLALLLGLVVNKKTRPVGLVVLFVVGVAFFLIPLWRAGLHLGW